jgi:hypothetical protein
MQALCPPLDVVRQGNPVTRPTISGRGRCGRAKAPLRPPHWQRRIQSCRYHIRGPAWYLKRWMWIVPMSGPTTNMEGIVVHHGAVDNEELPLALLNLKQALSLIQNRDPRHWKRLRSDNPSILLIRGGGTHCYLESINTIILDLPQVLTELTQLLASEIVHEATHARIAGATNRLGLRKMDEGRQERLCIEEEIAFMRRVARADDPRLEPWIARRRKLLETPWWTVRAKRVSLLKAMEKDGSFPWIPRVARFFWRL